MADFLSGASMMAAAAIALFFLRSWRRTRDRLFVMFALAFTMLALERWVLAIVSMEYEMRYLGYLIRLAAFLLILAAIVDKNRSSRPPPPGQGEAG